MRANLIHLFNEIYSLTFISLIYLIIVIIAYGFFLYRCYKAGYLDSSTKEFKGDVDVEIRITELLEDTILTDEQFRCELKKIREESNIDFK